MGYIPMFADKGNNELCTHCIKVLTFETSYPYCFSGIIKNIAIVLLENAARVI